MVGIVRTFKPIGDTPCANAQLPESNTLNVNALSNVLDNTTTSYKYFFFQALLKIIKQNQFEAAVKISFTEICKEMLALAWYPHCCLKLSLGIQDHLSIALDTIFDNDANITNSHNQIDLLKIIKKSDINSLSKKLLRYVPYRFLRPFFEKELRGVSDEKVNGLIVELALETFNINRPLYKICETEQIELNHEWSEYLRHNITLTESWLSGKLNLYLQSCNQSIPTNIINNNSQCDISERFDTFKDTSDFAETDLSSEGSGGCDIIEETAYSLAFDKMLDHPKPQYLITYEIWNKWFNLLKLSSIAFINIADFANRFVLSWPEDENDKLLSDYLFIDLLDLFEIENIDKKRTLFLAFSFAVECLEKTYYKGIPLVEQIEYVKLATNTKYQTEDHKIKSTNQPKANRDVLNVLIEKSSLILKPYSTAIDEDYLDLLIEELKELWLEYSDFGMQVNFPSKGKSYITYPFEELDDGLAKLLILNYCHSSYPDVSDLEMFMYNIFNYWLERDYLVRQSKSFYTYLLSIVMEHSYIETVYPYMVYDLTPHYLEDDPDDLVKYSAKEYFEKHAEIHDYSEITTGLDFDELVNKYKVLKNTTQDSGAVKDGNNTHTNITQPVLSANKLLESIFEDFF